VSWYQESALGVAWLLVAVGRFVGGWRLCCDEVRKPRPKAKRQSI
jgi:hypothetical protein